MRHNGCFYCCFLNGKRNLYFQSTQTIFLNNNNHSIKNNNKNKKQNTNMTSLQQLHPSSGSSAVQSAFLLPPVASQQQQSFALQPMQSQVPTTFSSQQQGNMQPTTVDLDQRTLYDILHDANNASTDIPMPSCDVPTSTAAFTMDESVKTPHYIPAPPRTKPRVHFSDDVVANEQQVSRRATHLSSKQDIQDWLLDHAKLPFLIGVLYFLFQMTTFRAWLQTIVTSVGLTMDVTTTTQTSSLVVVSGIFALVVMLLLYFLESTSQ